MIWLMPMNTVKPFSKWRNYTIFMSPAFALPTFCREKLMVLSADKFVIHCRVGRINGDVRAELKP